MRYINFSAWPLVALVGFALSVPAASTSTPYEVFEELPMAPEGWTELPSMRVNLQKSMAMRIHLAQQNVVKFEQKVMEISTPDHPSYGDHMDTEQIKSMLRPSQSTLNAVLTWLEDAGLGEQAVVEHDWIKMNVTIGQAQELLQTRYSYFRNDETQKIILRTLSYSLPAELHKHILLVQPTNMFGMRQMGSTIIKEVEDASLRQMKAFKQMAPGFNFTQCNDTIVPQCLKVLYNFQDYVAKAPYGKNKLGVNGFLEQYAQYEDLKVFVQNYAPKAIGANFSTVSVNGGLAIQNSSNLDGIAEANLDIQYTVSLSYPTQNIYYSTGGRPPYIPDLDVVTNDSEPYLDWLNWILDQPDIPQTITTSYGESEQTVPLSYRHTVCNLFAQLGARGVSVLFSSGDAGPGWSCRSNDGKNTTKFLPSFPASCPWVTSVGGTKNINPEEAVYFSSGGFSETWPVPSYQEKAVSAYFENNPDSWKPWEQYFVKGGRGFPDVAAQGFNYRVILNGTVNLIGGTSASSPAFAGLVSLLNDDRIANGKPPLGFLNPWLYSDKVAETFNDITHGRSTGCNGKIWGQPIAGNPAVVPGAGWDAVPGWDPVTGLGTPNFERMRQC
ncbi:uncharacterized protein H6S33_011182 [Morchella sextelata]|jgi:tripeptidyl-peptidase-1|uniref:uncharacterized protein n=1 Tax=Morchella sextelata TaxID=1174677 RepID=UPI001D042C3F|nr:uncharacterized protein H6S33_011182 [Morchella sextelata]KAH0610755.1 hypothetical protein H6S33_011182 [Morchella sextelata]